VLFEAMDSHDVELLILRVRHAQTSEERRESGHPVRSGASITARSSPDLFFVSRHPQFIDGSSTGFPQGR